MSIDCFGQKETLEKLLAQFNNVFHPGYAKRIPV